MYAAARLSSSMLAVRIQERGCKNMAGSEGEGRTASNAIWAVALMIIVAMIVWTVYYSGILKSRPKKSEIDVNINISTPSR